MRNINVTISDLLEGVKQFCKAKTRHFNLPTAVQKNDVEKELRAPEVFKMRLPISTSYKKYAPYIIVQLISTSDTQKEGEGTESKAILRLIFCVFDENEEEGALMLLNVMDAVRVGLLKERVVSDCFKLDSSDVEMLIYNEDTGKYQGGEMVVTFFVPPIERQVFYG